MKAVTLVNYGGFDQLTLQDLPIPEPRPNEVLIRIHAVALNPLDNKLRSGAMSTMMPLNFPYIPAYLLTGSSAKLMKQRKHCSLVDKQGAIEYAWEAASAKAETFAKTAKNPLIASHPRFINFAEDP